MWFITLTEENEKKRLARGPEGGETETLTEGSEGSTCSLNEGLCLKEIQRESFVYCRTRSITVRVVWVREKTEKLEKGPLSVLLFFLSCHILEKIVSRVGKSRKNGNLLQCGRGQLCFWKHNVCPRLNSSMSGVMQTITAVCISKIKQYFTINTPQDVTYFLLNSSVLKVKLKKSNCIYLGEIKQCNSSVMWWRSTVLNRVLQLGSTLICQQEFETCLALKIVFIANCQTLANVSRQHFMMHECLSC